jgi:hypothetical protein
VGGALAEQQQERGDLEALDPPTPSMPSSPSIHM